MDLSQTQLKLLDCLLISQPFAVESLTAACDCDTNDLWQHLHTLESFGCTFEQNTNGPTTTIKLTRAGLSTFSDYLHHAIDPPLSTVEVYRQTGSTQDAIRRIIAARGRDADRAIVVADEQQTGRGRLGRQWVTPAGEALLFSRAVVVDKGDTSEVINRLTSSTAVAIALAVESITSPKLTTNIKWPNDIMIDGQKLAGILVETSSVADSLIAIVGMGINVHQEAAALEELPKPATSFNALGRPVDRLRLLVEINRQLDALLVADSELIVHEWRKRSNLLGQTVTIAHGGQQHTGNVVDLDLHDGLVLRTQVGSLVHLPAGTSTIL